MSIRRGKLGVSLQTVAKVAGVSKSTVSRSLTRPEMVNRVTRERVEAVVAKLGYRYNAIARGLATGRTMALALFVPDIANPFFADLVRAAEDRAQAAGYAMLLADTDEHPEREQLLLERLASQVDGIVVCSARSATKGILAVGRELPMVLVNREIGTIPSVTCATGPGMAELVQHLHSYGHRQVAYLQGPASSWSNRERLSSVRSASKALGMRLNVLGPTHHPSRAGGRRLTTSSRSQSRPRWPLTT